MQSHRKLKHQLILLAAVGISIAYLVTAFGKYGIVAALCFVVIWSVVLWYQKHRRS